MDNGPKKGMAYCAAQDYVQVVKFPRVFSNHSNLPTRPQQKHELKLGKFPLSWARAEHLLDAQGFLRQEQKVNVETGSQDFSGGCGSPPFV